eukprot:TRINITY_DN12372_c0_g1_i2.p1 TRINITY_DN12372_c0_g1~~TRINITY_DN12372_c0_g1_i2.p1  ORF type:complete len:220 (-),score=45.42 TRINITY_DN12372_c0_g1_i2:121-780(-)
MKFLKILNKISATTAILGAIGLALQGVFPMTSNTLLLHCFCATFFFGILVVHVDVTCYMKFLCFSECRKENHGRNSVGGNGGGSSGGAGDGGNCICHGETQFWLKWKITCAVFISFFALLTVFIMLVGYHVDSTLVDVIYQVSHSSSPFLDYSYTPFYPTGAATGITTSTTGTPGLSPASSNGWVLICGAVCEYFLLFFMLFYFYSYLTELKEVTIQFS